MGLNLDSLGTIAIAAAAIAVGAATVHREFAPAHALGAAQNASVTYVANWKSLAQHGVWTGRSGAPLTIVEFADFECPYCKRFHKAVAQLEASRPGSVSLSFVHFPIETHRFARPAARAAECADKQGRFESMHDVLFDKQDSLGLKPWDDYAAEAGVANLRAFRECIRDTSTVARVEDGVAVGNAMSVHGTPTVIINGWRFPRPPYDSLPEIADRLLKGLDPHGATPPLAAR